MATILMKGLIYKKSPKGFKGFRSWQKRYWVLDTNDLAYYKSMDQKDKLGSFRVPDIEYVQFLPDRRIGCRFDVKVRGGKLYSLYCQTVDETQEWIRAINEAIRRSQCDDDEEKAATILDDAHYSKFQIQFFTHHFEKKILVRSGDTSEEQRRLAKIDQEFKSDHDVLKYLLINIIDPRKKIFCYDLTEDNPDTDSFSDAKDNNTKQQSLEDMNNDTTIREVLIAVQKKYRVSANIDKMVREFEDNLLKNLGDLLESDDWSDLRLPRKFMEALKEFIHLYKKRPIIKMLQEQTVAGLICTIFQSSSSEAHGLAIRVLWAVLRGRYGKLKSPAEFSARIEIYCNEKHFTKNIKDHLFSILLSTPGEVTQKIEPSNNIGSLPVKMPSTWKALFLAMKNSPPDIRTEALKDLLLLLKNPENCKSLQKASTWSKNKDCWQIWIYNLCTDIPKDQVSEEPWKTIYGLTTILLNLVHIQYFIINPSLSFSDILSNSIKQLHLFGGANTESQTLCSKILAGLIRTVKKSWINNFPTSSPHECTEWKNLKTLNRICQKYVFQTMYWQTTSDALFKGGTYAGQNQGIPLIPSPQSATKKISNDGPQIKGNPSFREYAERSGSVFESVNRESRGSECLSVEYEIPIHVLTRNHPIRGERKWDSNEIMLTDYGIHWDSDGNPVDIGLVKELCSLYKALKLDKPDFSLMGEIDQDEKDFRLSLKKEFALWQDALTFFDKCHGNDVGSHKTMTYRRFSHLSQDFLFAKSSKARKRLFKLIDRIKEGETIADSEFAEFSKEKETNDSGFKVTNQTKINDLLVQLGKEVDNPTLSQYIKDFEGIGCSTIKDLKNNPSWFEDVQVPFRVKKVVRQRIPADEDEDERNSVCEEKSPVQKVKKITPRLTPKEKKKDSLFSSQLIPKEKKKDPLFPTQIIPKEKKKDPLFPTQIIPKEKKKDPLPVSAQLTPKEKKKDPLPFSAQLTALGGVPAEPPPAHTPPTYDELPVEELWSEDGNEAPPGLAPTTDFPPNSPSDDSSTDDEDDEDDLPPPPPPPE